MLLYGRHPGLLTVVLAGLVALGLVACAPAAVPGPTSAPAKAAQPTSATAKSSTTGAPVAQSTDQSGGSPVEIRIGHGFAAEEQLWLMAAKPEITPNQGKAYTLTLVAFRGNADRLSAYEAGQIDGGTTSAATALFAVEQGLPLKLVASVSREVTDARWHNTTYLALEGSGIRSASDLKGKTIGIVDFRSATDLWARAAVESAGLDPNSDVKYVVVPFPAMGESVRTGKIDVGAFPNPFYVTEKSRGGVVDVFTSKTGVPFDEELIMLFLRPDFVSQHQAAVKAFLADYVAATKWYLAHGKEARQALIDKKFVQTPPEVYLEMQDWYREATGKLALDGLDKLQELHVKLGWQSKKVDLSTVVDQSLLP